MGDTMTPKQREDFAHSKADELLERLVAAHFLDYAPHVPFKDFVRAFMRRLVEDMATENAGSGPAPAPRKAPAKRKAKAK